MSENDFGDTPPKVTSKIPIRIGSATATPKQSRIPTRFGCESPAKQNKSAEKNCETYSYIKISESAGCTNRKITEPHRVTISESLPLAPLKGSEGDQFCSRKSQNVEMDPHSVHGKKFSIDVLMEPRLLSNKVSGHSGVQIARSESLTISTVETDSLHSVCVDKSCDEVGEISEVDGVDSIEIKTDNVWEPVSEYLLTSKNKMRTAGAQTSEASNIDDMDCVESGKYSVYSYDKVTATYIPGKMKPCPEINEIKIRHPTPKPLVKLAATALGIVPITQENDYLNPDIQETIMSNPPENKSPAEKGDLKRKDTYTVFTEENSKDMIVNDGGDGNQISAEMDKKEDILVEDEEWGTENNPLCVNISTITPSVIRGTVQRQRQRPVFDVYPQVLLLIPDIRNPGGYVAPLKISNNSADIRAYKICLNKSANNHLLIEPQYGILPAFSEITIEILSRSGKKDPIGGFCQRSVHGAILEVRSMEIFNMANQCQLSKLWRMAEARFSHSISSVRITSINILEPCNKRVLDAFDEPTAAELREIMKQKYDSMIPRMLENREVHLHEIQLTMLEGRIWKVWCCVRHMDFYFDMGFLMAYILAAYWGFFPNAIEGFGGGNGNAQITPTDDSDSTFGKFSRFVINLIGVAL